jgi:TusE/DsrC/DsvC family sulfur relay protein
MPVTYTDIMHIEISPHPLFCKEAMPVKTQLNTRKIAVDHDGYLIDFDDWDEETARELAARANVGELSAESIAILKFIRNHYKAYWDILYSRCQAQVHVLQKNVSLCSVL